MPQRPASVPINAVWSEKDQEWVLSERDAAGARVGEVSYFRPDGSLCCVSQYVAGKADGVSRRFHESGEVSMLAHYVDGVLHGVRIWYASDSPTTEKMHSEGLSDAVVRVEVDYVHGNLRAFRYFDRDDKPVTAAGMPLPPRPANVPETANFMDTAEQWLDGLYDASGNPIEESNAWSADGVLLLRTTREDDRIRRTLFYDNGNPRLSITLRDTTLDGAAQAWRRDGTVLRRAELRDDAFAGPIEEYDRSGVLARTVKMPTVPASEPVAEPESAAADCGGGLSPHEMARAIAVGWFGDRERDAEVARAARRQVLAAARPSLLASLTALGLDRAPRVQTATRLSRVVSALGADAGVDQTTLHAHAVSAGSTGACLALSDPATSRATLSARISKEGDLVGLANLGLTEVPAAIGSLPALQVVLLNGNQLRTLPPAIGNLLQLRRLDLTRNRIEHLPAELGLLTELRALHLADNGLREVPAALLDLGELTTLGLGDNELLALPDDFGRLGRLETLWLNDNPLTDLPASMAQLGRLRFLHLGGLPLEEPPSCLYEMESLETLWLVSRSLRRLPPQICRLPRLQKLCVWYSSLTEVPDELYEMSNLKELRIRNNSLPDSTYARIKEALPNCVIY